MFNIFKQNTEKQHKAETMRVVNARLAHNQESVFRAVEGVGRPINGLALAKEMGWDSASVTNRLSELVKKGRLKVAYVKRGLDGINRKFYAVNESNEREYDAGD